MCNQVLQCIHIDGREVVSTRWGQARVDVEASCVSIGTDRDIGGIEQPCAGVAMWRRGAHLCAIDLELRARCLDLSTMARIFSTLGFDDPLHRRQTAWVVQIAFEHHGAAIAVDCGTGVHLSLGLHRDTSGWTQVACALPSTTHQNLPPTQRACGIHDAGACQVDLIGL